jgi:hypothetical protein
LSTLEKEPNMAEKHSGWSRTSRGARASSQGAPTRTSRIDNGARVDSHGVPLKYTAGSGIVLPDEFYAEFRANPEAAVAKWTTDETK